MALLRRRVGLSLLLAAGALAAGGGVASLAGAADGGPVAGIAGAASQKGGPSAPLGRATRTRGCHVRGPLPDPRCTPGAIFTRASARVICRRGYAGRVRDVSQSLKRKVYASYGIRHHRRGTYEVDHLVSLELGGSNDESNLFPEAADPRPGFHEKDRLENRLHAVVCDGEMSLRTAQRRIAGNWLTEYRRQRLG